MSNVKQEGGTPQLVNGARWFTLKNKNLDVCAHIHIRMQSHVNLLLLPHKHIYTHCKLFIVFLCKVTAIQRKENYLRYDKTELKNIFTLRICGTIRDISVIINVNYGKRLQN